MDERYSVNRNPGSNETVMPGSISINKHTQPDNSLPSMVEMDVSQTNTINIVRNNIL